MSVALELRKSNIITTNKIKNYSKFSVGKLSSFELLFYLFSPDLKCHLKETFLNWALFRDSYGNKYS